MQNEGNYVLELVKDIREKKRQHKRQKRYHVESCSSSCSSCSYEQETNPIEELKPREDLRNTSYYPNETEWKELLKCVEQVGDCICWKKDIPPVIRYHGKVYRFRRLMYLLFIADPKRQRITMTCKNKQTHASCVNPTHFCLPIHDFQFTVPAIPSTSSSPRVEVPFRNLYEKWKIKSPPAPLPIFFKPQHVENTPTITSDLLQRFMIDNENSQQQQDSRSYSDNMSVVSHVSNSSYAPSDGILLPMEGEEQDQNQEWCDTTILFLNPDNMGDDNSYWYTSNE